MKISTRSRYGLRAMVELALNYGGGPLSLREIEESQGISQKYLEQIVPHLKTAGFLRSVQGSAGGYILTSYPEEVTVLEILQALEGRITLVDCVDQPNICDRKSGCATRELWVEIAELTMEYLRSKTLAELARRQEIIGDQS